jgi:hypothetical protein
VVEILPEGHLGGVLRTKVPVVLSHLVNIRPEITFSIPGREFLSLIPAAVSREEDRISHLVSVTEIDFQQIVESPQRRDGEVQVDFFAQSKSNAMTPLIALS